MTQQISIRLDDDLYQWLTEKVSSIRPETTINKYVNWLIEREWGKDQAIYTVHPDKKERIEVGKIDRPYNITVDGQIEGGE